MADFESNQFFRKSIERAFLLATAILECTADGVLVVDAQGKILAFNQLFIQMWNLPPYMLTYRDDQIALAYVMEQLIDPEAFLSKVREVYAHPDQPTSEVLHFKDARVFERYSRPLRIDDRNFGVVWTFRDVTSRTLTERERDRLLESERKARDAAEAVRERFTFLANASVLLANTLDYTSTLNTVIRLAVPRLTDWCGIYLNDERQQPGLVALEHQDSAMRELGFEYLRKYSAAGQAPPGVVQVMRTGKPMLWPADGSQDEFMPAVKALGLKSAILSPLMVHGRPFGVLFLAQADSGRSFGPDDLALADELSYRAALALENSRLYRDSQHAVRMQEELLEVVSHDLKNPLTAILMNISILSRSLKEENRTRGVDSAIANLRSATDRMLRLTRDLLTQVKIEAKLFKLERSEISAAELAENTVRMLAPLADEKEQTIVTRIDENLPTLYCDRDRILQAFGNLVENAIKFSPRNGEIAVRIESMGEQVVFRVKDRGPGINEKDMRKVFTRFWQTGESAKKGSGLGLYIAKSIVDAHGGKIWAESAPGAGSEFIFTLPTAKSARRTPSDSDSKAA